METIILEPYRKFENYKKFSGISLDAMPNGDFILLVQNWEGEELDKRVDTKRELYIYHDDKIDHLCFEFESSWLFELSQILPGGKIFLLAENLANEKYEGIVITKAGEIVSSFYFSDDEVEDVQTTDEGTIWVNYPFDGDPMIHLFDQDGNRIKNKWIKKFNWDLGGIDVSFYINVISDFDVYCCWDGLTYSSYKTRFYHFKNQNMDYWEMPELSESRFAVCEQYVLLEGNSTESSSFILFHMEDKKITKKLIPLMGGKKNKKNLIPLEELDFQDKNGNSIKYFDSIRGQYMFYHNEGAIYRFDLKEYLIENTFVLGTL